MNLKCRYHLLCVPAPWKGCQIWHAGLTHSLTLNNGDLPAISWTSLMNVGHAECSIGNLWKRTSGTSSNELDDQIWTIFSIKALPWLEAEGWPMGDGSVRLHQILYTVNKILSEVVHNFLLIALLRAWKRPVFSTCEPPTLYFTCTRPKIESSRSMSLPTAKFNAGYAMLIPKAPIHSSISLTMEVSYLRPSIPWMKYFVAFKCPSCATWKFDNWPAQLPETNVETPQISIVHGAMTASETCQWYHSKNKVP